jgi:acyl-CoA synthetase (AMP-forming)/AMP-acid ligase II
VEHAGAWTSWGGLAAGGAALEARLQVAGLPEAAAVGVWLRSRPPHVAALLGLLAGRRCLVALNPIGGAARLGEELRALRLEAVVGAEEDWALPGLAEAAREAGSAAFALGAAADAPLRALPGLARPGDGPHHERLPGVAVVISTSGTTGPPRRVRLAARSLEHALLSSAHYESARDPDAEPRLRSGVAIVSSPLVHVSGLWRLLQSLLAGRRVALLERFSVAAWRELVLRHRPRQASLVPAALRMVLEAGLAREDLASLRAVTSGTAPLDPALAEAFEARYGIPVLGVYGATEFAGGVAGWTLEDKRRFGAGRRGSAGRANPGVELRVVDPRSGRALPCGELGLLEVRAPQLEGGGEGWVRTTDLARLDAEGFLFLEGRADDAILRGGFKIAPGEVARALERHPAVREAAVVGLPDPRLGEVPAAAVELEPGAEAPGEEELLAFARERLAGYQVPVRIRVVQALPRTPSLKVSRPAVRELLAGG